MPQPTFATRSSGLLLHLTSLPGRFGSGDLGSAAHAFVDLLADAKQTWWQMLPVNPPSDAPNFSPYSSTSAFAGSPYLISLELLVEDGLLNRSALKSSASFDDGAVAQLEAGSVRRLQTLRLAFDRFEASGERATQQAYATFCRAKRSWLDDWSLYAALRESNGGQAWFRWPRPIRLRQPAAMAEARRSLAREVQFQNFVQFLFDRQWNALHEHARSRGVGLIGDVPIFVAHDSADVWAQRELFMLDAEGLPKTVTGYPADEFTTDGQIWGHPHYRWAAHRRERFQWWIRRFRGILSNFDAVRIDHFLGFIKAWNIPYGAKTGRIGHWVKSPGRELFDELRRQIPKAEILAEDLGLLSPEAIRLRDHAGFPGMRLIQFGFYPNAQYHLPFKFVPDCVVYTGTHDNDTLVGWASDLRDSAGKMHVAPKQRPKRDEARATWEKICRFLSTDNVRQMPIAAMRHLMASVANTVIVPVQDLLALGSTSRMNTPGRDEDNWRWRLLAGQLKAEHAKLLSEMTTTFDRAPVEGPDARG